MEGGETPRPVITDHYCGLGQTERGGEREREREIERESECVKEGRGERVCMPG